MDEAYFSTAPPRGIVVCGGEPLATPTVPGYRNPDRTPRAPLKLILRRPGRIGFTPFFAVGWNALAVLIWVLGRPERVSERVYGSPPYSLSQSVFLFGLILIYAAIDRLFFCPLTIDVTNEAIALQQRTISSFFNAKTRRKCIPVHDVVQLCVKERHRKEGSVGSGIIYQLVAISRNAVPESVDAIVVGELPVASGVAVPLCELENAEQAHFLEKTIEEHLGITDHAVQGEHQPS